MRIYRLLLMVIVFFQALTTGAQGWRPGEAEVKVYLKSPADVEKVRSLGLDFEPAATDGSAVRMYLVPAEMEKLSSSKLPHTVTIPDLNAHYAGYWERTDVPPGYYTYEEIIAVIDSLALHFPSICRKESWGLSVGNRQLAALKISDNVNSDEPEPEIMFDGGIHGDEVGGPQNVIMFARDLCLAYGNDPAITSLIDTREIWLYPMVNPDGRVSMSRYNANFVDCNRDNGYMWNAEGFSTSAFSQVETKTLRNALLNNQMVIYTNYHSGIEIISYPWSYRSAGPRDLAHLYNIAGIYSSSSGYAGGLVYGQGYNIMYAINGSTKDFVYGSLGQVGWSIEISTSKQPPSSQIGYFYSINKPAMLEVIEHCGYGISGSITDSLTGQPVPDIVWVDNLFPVYTDPVVGDFHKYLVAGTYNVTVTANGYQPKTVSGVTVPTLGTATVNVQMAPGGGHYAYKVMSCQIPGNNFSDEGYTPGSIGAPDSVFYALGRNGWIVLDMGDTINDLAGNDFRIIQKGSVNKSYTVSGSNLMDGPFTTIGTASGTAAFDLSSAGMAHARYLKIKDNGTGAATGPGAGFNLDAVEVLLPTVTADFTSTYTQMCSGGYVDFADNSSGNPATWSWSFPGATPSSSTAQNPGNIQYPSPGTYDVSLTVSNPYSSSTLTRNGYMTVSPHPAVSVGNDTTVCEWGTVPLDAGNPGSSYLWSTGDTTQYIVADSTGTGYGTVLYWVRVRNLQDCESADTIFITFDDCTAIGENGRSAVQISPNPSTSVFTLTIRGHGKGEWTLAGTSGQCLAGGRFDGSTFRQSIPTGHLAPGIYFLTIAGSEAITTKKVMVVRGKD